jgi:hypothetical protein
MLKIITEKTFIDYRLKAAAALAAYEKRASDEEFESSEHQAALQGLVEFLELVAIGITTRVVDEDICFETLGVFMVEAIGGTEAFVAAQAEHVLANLRPIGARWSRRLARKGR